MLNLFTGRSINLKNSEVSYWTLSLMFPVAWRSRKTLCLHYNNIFSKVVSLVAPPDGPRRARPAVCPGRPAPIYKTQNYLNLQDTVNMCQCLWPLPSSGPHRQTLAGLFSLGSHTPPPSSSPPPAPSSSNTPVFSFSPSWPPSPLCVLT